jgi:hypothetical protein
LDAELAMLFEDLDEALALPLGRSRDPLSIEQQIFVAGEGLARIGEVVGLRAEVYLQEINYLLYPDKEPVLGLDGFDRYVRQTMTVDLEQFCAAPELPEVERGYQRAVVEPMSEAEAIAEIVAAIHEAEPSPLELAHDEDIPEWSARVMACLAREPFAFVALSQATELAPTQVWLGLLFGERPIIVTGQNDFYSSDFIVSVEGVL